MREELSVVADSVESLSWNAEVQQWTQRKRNAKELSDAFIAEAREGGHDALSLPYQRDMRRTEG